MVIWSPKNVYYHVWLYIGISSQIPWRSGAWNGALPMSARAYSRAQWQICKVVAEHVLVVVVRNWCCVGEITMVLRFSGIWITPCCVVFKLSQNGVKWTHGIHFSEIVKIIVLVSNMGMWEGSHSHPKVTPYQTHTMFGTRNKTFIFPGKSNPWIHLFEYQPTRCYSDSWES